MARVATCPQCSHEILILDDDNQEAWAKCPECRAFFQIMQVEGREIQAAIRVDEQPADRGGETVVVDDTMLDTFISKGDATLSGASDATVSKYGGDDADAGRDDVDIAQDPQLSDELISIPAAEQPGEATVTNQSEATLAGPDSLLTEGIDMPAEDVVDTSNAVETEYSSAATPEERLEHAEDRIDKWFRQTKAQLDTPQPVTGDSDEFEMELASDQDAIRPTWDDSDHMDRLLADAERPGDSNPSEEYQASEEDESAGSDEQPEKVSVEESPTAEPPQFFIPPGRLPRRTRSPLRTLAAAAISGVVGLALGYLALLWLLGPTGDFLNIAQHLPAAILPGDFQTDLIPLPGTGRDGPPPGETLAGPDAASQEASSAEQQASYTTPTPSEDNNNLMGNEPPGDANLPGTEEPQPIFEPPVAAPLANAKQVSAGHLLDPSSFSADELAVALRTSQDAQPKLVAGSLDDGREVQRAKGFSYSLLCDLAQKLIFVDVTTRVDYVKALEADAIRLFQQTLGDEHARKEVARILPKWIASPHRKHGGVFFAGTISQQAEKGTVIECQLDAGANETMIVLVPPGQAEQVANSSAPVGIVGWIVDSPADKVSGYTGVATQAVWAGRILVLE